MYELKILLHKKRKLCSLESVLYEIRVILAINFIMNVLDKCLFVMSEVKNVLHSKRLDFFANFSINILSFSSLRSTRRKT